MLPFFLICLIIFDCLLTISSEKLCYLRSKLKESSSEEVLFASARPQVVFTWVVRFGQGPQFVRMFSFLFFFNPIAMLSNEVSI